MPSNLVQEITSTYISSPPPNDLDGAAASPLARRDSSDDDGEASALDEAIPPMAPGNEELLSLESLGERMSKLFGDLKVPKDQGSLRRVASEFAHATSHMQEWYLYLRATRVNLEEVRKTRQTAWTGAKQPLQRWEADLMERENALAQGEKKLADAGEGHHLANPGAPFHRLQGSSYLRWQVDGVLRANQVRRSRKHSRSADYGGGCHLHHLGEVPQPQKSLLRSPEKPRRPGGRPSVIGSRDDV